MASTLLHARLQASALSEEFSTNACGLCAVLTLMNGLCAKSAGSASNYPAGAKDWRSACPAMHSGCDSHVVAGLLLRPASTGSTSQAWKLTVLCLSSQPFSASERRRLPSGK